MIDRKNRCHQEDLEVETMGWFMWVNISLMGMMVMDVWLVCRGFYEESADFDQRVFYCQLSEQHFPQLI